MPPIMPEYRQQARRRMKRGLLPEVVAAAEAQRSNLPGLVNHTGNARSGQTYADEVTNGHHVHVYAGGQRVGVADKINPMIRLPGDRSGFAPGSGQGVSSPRPADLAGQQAELQAQQAAKNAQVSVGRPVSGGPGQIVQTNYDKEAAALVGLAKAKAKLGVNEAPAGNHGLLERLAKQQPRRRRRGTGRITGGMLAS